MVARPSSATVVFVQESAVGLSLSVNKGLGVGMDPTDQELEELSLSLVTGLVHAVADANEGMGDTLPEFLEVLKTMIPNGLSYKQMYQLNAYLLSNFVQFGVMVPCTILSSVMGEDVSLRHYWSQIMMGRTLGLTGEDD